MTIAGNSSSSNGISCTFCGGEATILLTTPDRNRRVSNKQFTYWRCRLCELVFLADPPEGLGEYYPQVYYELPSLQKLECDAVSSRYKIEMTQRFVSSGRLLEIGAASGSFSFGAKRAGFEVHAIEMDRGCCDYLRRVVGVNAIQSDAPHEILPTLPPNDVIAMWHVLEHLPRPWACLEAAAANLSRGGVLLIATPNPSALQFRILRAQWPHVDAPRHLFVIPYRLLSRFMASLGLELVMLTTTDKGARGWNRFGWQRYFMNHFKKSLAQKLAFLIGSAVSIPLALWEGRELNGSAYTAVFRKRLEP